ncbi:DNA ligase D [Xanthomonas sp. 3058]|uniref:DNA ligase D n=1 Tax=Xanthomonas sp. 3058 TaxID=3035314 RepID=UPI001614284A|nr:DNA ligase D [Xanthomonas sp. 3058]MBB5866122.1 bifunctional non-homologous end joining protein LigD [Xanthomonas sp. 3058]
MTLHDYNSKRRFDQTPEPAGGMPARANKQPIFVVQLHHARARHYDFRLEAAGVLKSWAVPKGPSLRVGEKRLAVQVEDHPLSYASFEGEIPQGHYGAGHVDVFDHGHWHCEGDVVAALDAGKLEFDLQGTHLRGGFALVRTKMRGGKPQWLLIKRTDAYAADLDADALVAQHAAKTSAAAARVKASDARRPPSTATTRTSTVPGKRKRSGGSDSKQWRTRALAVDGARDAPCPTELRAQLTLLREQAPDGDRWLHEIKWDGYRLLADMVDGHVQLRSRNDQAWTERFPDVVRAVQALPVRDARLDGELVVLDAQGRSDFSALQRTLDGSVRQALRYIVFDLLGIAGVDLRDTPLLQRKQLLRELLGATPDTLAYSDHVIGSGPAVFAASADKGWEGIISKLAEAGYRGGRSADWIKTKHENSDEFVVVGYTDPKGARSGFGALLLAQRDGEALRYVGRVGTGFDDALLGSIAKQLRALHCDTATLALPAHLPARARDLHWVRPVLIAEVAFRGWAKEGLLRQAAFKRLREDKPVAELGGDRAAPRTRAASTRGGAVAATAADTGKRAQKTTRPASTTATRKRVRSTVAKPAVPSPTAASKKGSTTRDGVAITHPERVVFPAAGISKGDVADYYRAVAPLVLAEIARRPLSLLRCPDGAGGDCFFQKHEGRHLGANIKAIPLQQKSGTEDYIYLEDAAGLLELVQMNTLELHPWGAQIDDPEHPDRLVFDLDPGDGVSWPDVVAAARDIRAKLRSAGLESAVRLSGGKGLHVVVPIVPEAGWEQARDFCEAFAQALATHTPDRYVATMSKAKRHGVIFVDWLRNGRGNTSVCSWSLRAREKATVAVPLRWEELGKISGPDAFPMDKALQRAKRQRQDPWESVLALRQYLPTGDDNN